MQTTPQCSKSKNSKMPMKPEAGIGPGSLQSKRTSISRHKLAEMEGGHAEEPLLKKNPGRFVLFPIKDAEVSSEQPVGVRLCKFLSTCP